MKKIFFLIGILSFSLAVVAQESAKSKREEKREKRRERITQMVKLEEEGVITNKKHFLGGLKITTDGYGGFLEKGMAQSVKNAMLFQFELTERKHPKEFKQISIAGGGPFVYGKINFFYTAKLGVQEQFLLGNKGNKNGVSVSANVGGGLTLGLLRPYLLAYPDTSIAGRGNLIYKGLEPTKADSLRFVNDNPIGGPSFGTGFNKLKINPGAYAKAALRFDYGKFNEVVSALEVGVTAEFYSKKVQQMIYSKDNNFFFTAYVAILFGKRK
jgi:hypothetical protein